MSACRGDTAPHNKLGSPPAHGITIRESVARGPTYGTHTTTTALTMGDKSDELSDELKKPIDDEFGPEINKEDESAGKSFEDILDDIGAFGHWQRVIFVLISLADIQGAFAILSPVFVHAVPLWRCKEWSNGVAEDGREDWNDLCTINGTATTCVAYEYYDDFTSIVSQWDLVCELSYIGDVITSVQMAGLMIGAGLCGQFSDLIGRKKTYFLVFYFMLLCGFLSSFSVNWEMYMVLRFLMGIGFGGLMVVASVFPMEFVGKTWRVFCGTIGFWALGIMLMAPLAYGLREWKHLQYTIFLSGLPYFILWWFIPESPRWLLQHGRLDEAHDIMVKISSKNGKPAPSKDDLAALAAREGEGGRRYTYLDLFKVPLYAKRALIMFTAWFTVFLVYYGVSFGLGSLSGNRYLNMFYSGFVDLVAMLSVIVILNFLGRRKSLILYTGICALSMLTVLSIIAAGKETELGMAILWMSLLGKAAGVSGTYNVQIFTAELFPTVIRNLAVGFGSVAGRIGGIVSPQLRTLGNIYALAPYILCLLLACIVVCLAFTVPETVGRPLADRYQPQDDGMPKGKKNKKTVSTKM